MNIYIKVALLATMFSIGCSNLAFAVTVSLQCSFAHTTYLNGKQFGKVGEGFFTIDIIDQRQFILVYEKGSISEEGRVTTLPKYYLLNGQKRFITSSMDSFRIDRETGEFSRRINTDVMTWADQAGECKKIKLIAKPKF